MSDLTIRRVRPGDPDDRKALYDICLRTGDYGKDATDQFTLPNLLGDVYVGPYILFHPLHCFAISRGNRPVGYVLGVPDTQTFEKHLPTTWWPQVIASLPERHPDSPALTRRDVEVMSLITSWEPTATTEILEKYPAHLHIDLLPEAQGGGMGRQLIETLFDSLRAAGARGVHLGVSSSNLSAIGFYRHLGFTTLDQDAAGLTLGKSL